MAQSFGAQMRQRREERQVALGAIVEKTKIKQSLLEALERDDLSHWPNGFFRRAFIRAYAQAIGLEPDEVLREFLDFHGETVVDTSAITSLAATADARSTTGPPTRLRQIVGSAVTRFRSSNHAAVTPSERGAAAVAAAAPAVSQGRRADPDVVPLGDLLAIANLCARLGRARRTDSLPPLLQEADRILDATGLIVWTWDTEVDRLRASWAHGYSDTLLSQLPLVPVEAENAVAAAFRSTRTSYVAGGDSGCHAVVVPLLTANGCVGALAIELRQADEVPGRVEAVATIIAAQLARVVAEPPAAVAFTQPDGSFTEH